MVCVCVCVCAWQIGNCVGANNHGYFILFLIFTTVSCLYVLIMVLYTYTHAKAYWMVAESETLSERDTLNLGLDLMAGVLSSLLFDNQVAFTIRSIGLLYLFVASLVLLIGVGLLLHQQLVLVYSGQTYLDSITPLMAAETDPPGLSGKRGWMNFQRLFGKKNPLLWLLPSLNFKRFHAGKVMSSILWVDLPKSSGTSQHFSSSQHFPLEADQSDCKMEVINYHNFKVSQLWSLGVGSKVQGCKNDPNTFVP